MKRQADQSKRNLLVGLSAIIASSLVRAQSYEFKPNQRYPDPAVFILDPSFTKYRLHNSTLEQISTGMRWTEGPAYFSEGSYLLFSDIPNNRIMKFSEKTGKTSIFRENANFANGNVRDHQGRLITCEHSVTRRVTRTEKDGRITILADRYQGRRLNSPNDVIVKSDASIWFSDPVFGISGEWEGYKATPEQMTTNVYRLDTEGKLVAMIVDLVNPNGLAFSADEKKLYVVESGGIPNNILWVYDVAIDGSLSNKAKFIDGSDNASLDGIKVDIDGNLWVAYGSSGVLEVMPTVIGGNNVYRLKGNPEDLDGVMVFNPKGEKIGFIKLPERCANLTFGGQKNNRLYMASSHSVYALYLGDHGSV